MANFDDRKKAFEKKFEVDEEQKFRIASRAAKLLGLWAAAQLGKTGADADTYAREVVEADLAEPGHNDVLAKVEKDLSAKGVSRHRIEKEFAECQKTAHEQLAGSTSGKA